MHDPQFTREALREYEAATKDNEKKPEPNKPEDTDWKALDDNAYRAEMRKRFGLNI